MKTRSSSKKSSIRTRRSRTKSPIRIVPDSREKKAKNNGSISPSSSSFSSSSRNFHQENEKENMETWLGIPFEKYIFGEPHSATAGLVVLLAIAYATFALDATDTRTNVHRGVKAVVSTFLIFCAFTLQQRNHRGPVFRRPHPMIWRTVLGLNLLYLLVCIFVVMQNVDDVRRWLGVLDPGRLGVEIPKRAYAEDCRLVTPEHPKYLKGGFVWVGASWLGDGTSEWMNMYLPSQLWYFGKVMDTVVDEFFLAHLLGWIVKGMIFRDFYFCWMLSIGFEWMEITFAHVMPNFHECWFDQLICDILFANGLGIAIGLYLCRYWNSMEYQWLTVKDSSKRIKSEAYFRSLQVLGARLKRISLQLTPRRLEPMNWWRVRDGGSIAPKELVQPRPPSPTRRLSTSSFRKFFSFSFPRTKRFFQIVVILMVGYIVEVGGSFFIKNILWIPNSHPIMLGRLFVLSTGAACAARELYLYVTEQKGRRMGATFWVVMLWIIVEFFIVLKFGMHLFVNSVPFHVVAGWSIIALSLSVWCGRCFFLDVCDILDAEN